MTMSVPERISGSGGKEEESEDESEILEESPCGRWQKRKEQVGAYMNGAEFKYSSLPHAAHAQDHKRSGNCEAMQRLIYV